MSANMKGEEMGAIPRPFIPLLQPLLQIGLAISGVARLAVGNVGNRAGVNDVHVGRLVSGDKAIPSFRELPREYAGIRLIELAAVSLDSDSWPGCKCQFDGRQ